MKKGGGSESTIIIGPSKSVLVYALHSLEYVLGLARFRVFVPNLLLFNLNTKIWLEELSFGSNFGNLRAIGSNRFGVISYSMPSK